MRAILPSSHTFSERKSSGQRSRGGRATLLLAVIRLPRGLPGPRHQAHPHQALHAENKRQGRALHSDGGSGMGLCPSLPNIRSSGPRAAVLAASIQLASAPWWYRLSNADQQARFDQEQPLEAPQLVSNDRHERRRIWAGEPIGPTCPLAPIPVSPRRLGRKPRRILPLGS